MRVLCKSISVVLMLMFMFGTTVIAETEVKHEDLANVLKEAGFFKGSDKGFELEREPSRAESAALMVRMLGKEELVKSREFKHPFTDVPVWANSYVGYLYENGMTKGIGGGKFGSTDLVTASQYLTFVLRALGYDDSNDDFNWKESVEKAKELGIISESEYADLIEGVFLRDHAVLATFRGLRANVKGRDTKLIEVLVERKDVAVESLDVILLGVSADGSTGGSDESIDGDSTGNGDGSTDAADEVKALFLKAQEAIAAVDSMTLNERMDMTVDSVDPASGESVVVMSVELVQRSEIDFANTMADISADTKVNLFGMQFAVIESKYADSEHYYIYSLTTPMAGFGANEETFGDYYGNEEYLEEYSNIFARGSSFADFSEAGDMEAMDVEGLEVTEYTNSIVITGTEGLNEVFVGDEKVSETELDVSSFLMEFDKETGLLIECEFVFDSTDEEGLHFYGSFEYSVEDINVITVEISSEIAKKLETP